MSNPCEKHTDVHAGGYCPICLLDELDASRKECDAITELNHAQFLELEYLRPIGVAAEQLFAESEEYEFDDGLGKGALQEYWDELSATLENMTDAQKTILAREGEKT